jgi:hypothetical protein
MKSYVQPRKTWLSESSAYYKEELNPKFWASEDFDPMVRTKLLAIAQDFYEGLQLTVPVIDVQLTGSIANYTWTEYSDLDVHVILDFKSIGEDLELVKKALDGQRFIWNMRHPVIIKEHDVELYAQDQNEPHVSSGLFSLMKNEWIKKPDWNEPVIDELDVKRKVEAYITEIEELERNLADGSDEFEARELLERVGALKTKIMKSRKDGLAEVGEFSIENLVFKQLRNQGWIERLIEAGAKSYSAIYADPKSKEAPQQEEVNEDRIYPGGLVFVLGKEQEGGSRLYLFDIEWAREVSRPGGWLVNMVGLRNPMIIKRVDGELKAKSIAASPRDIQRAVGITNMSVVLNAKTKTPFWHDTVKLTSVSQVLNIMKYRLPAIPNLNLD